MTVQPGSIYPSFDNPPTCPFLGLEDDEKTALGFPSDWNNCHRCKPVTPVKLDHQRLYCLNLNHKNCIVYAQPQGNTMPRELRNRYPAQAQGGVQIWKILLTLVILGLFISLGLFYYPQIRSALPLESLDFVVQATAPAAELPVEVTPSPELSPTTTASPQPASSTPTQVVPTLFIDDPVLVTTIAIQASPTITRIPRDIETLIGINYIFKIHRVTHGENLETLAFLNGTTIAAIFAVNYNFSAPLWVDQVIILPINQTDVSDLPPFEPYRVTEDISLEDLAIKLDADPDQIQYYNGLGSSNQLREREWIIVPREKEQGD